MSRLLLLLLIALPVCPSDLLDYLMPDARVVLGINMRRLRESRFGQAVWSKLASQNPDYAKLIRTTGFDPLRDIGEMVAASPGVNRKQSGLMLVRGSFDPVRLRELGKRQGGAAQNWAGVEVLLKQSEQGAMALAVPSPSLIIAGDPHSVRQALSGGGRPARLAPGLREAAVSLAERYDAWVVSIIPLAELAAEAPDPRAAAMLKGDSLQAVEQFSFGLRVGGGIELSLAAVTRTPQDAESLAGVVRFFAGMAASKGSGAPPAIQVSGNQLQVSVVIPEPEVEKALGAAGSLAAEPAAPAPPAPAGPPRATGVTIYSSPRDMGTRKLPPKP